jgi:hypothetical protein
MRLGCQRLADLAALVPKASIEDRYRDALLPGL